MLLSFRMENVRSFRDETELSMLATPLAEQRFVREIDWRESGRPIKVLPVAGIFGANASGKTNLLEAMDDMRMYVVESFRRDLDEQEHWPFRLVEDAKSRPSRYEIDLVLNGVRHQYGFVLGNAGVLEEWAFRYPHGRPATLFERKGDAVESAQAGRAETRDVQKLLRPRSLFLSTAAAAKHPLLIPLHDWFRHNLILAHARNRRRRQALTVDMLQAEDRQQSRERVLTLLRAADLGIVDAHKHALDPDVKERLAAMVRALAGDDADIDTETLSATVESELGSFRLVHAGVDQRMEFPLGFESLGTEVWLGLIGPVLTALTAGAAMLADELDASLHPSLVAQLIRLFQDPETNPRRAQLIFNAHDPTMLGDSDDERLLGRDQTWFTEKLADGSTRLYPLSDFKPRKSEAVGRRYLSGRYGAVPILSWSAFDSIVESSEPDE